MAKKPQTLDPVPPNRGLEIAYQRKLEALVDAMQKSLVWWITAAYREKPPEMATDASPAMNFRDLLKKLGRYWMRRIDKLAPDLAKHFAKSAMQHTDSSMRAALAKGKVPTIVFKMTPAANDIIQATIGEQVRLIKSIGQEHLSDVEGIVMRSIQSGGDLHTMSLELQKRYGLTKKRAAFISHDQTSKANASMTRARQLEAGITKAMWVHSHAGKEPRPSHVAAGKAKLVYDVADGAYIDGEWIFPGEKINCRCLARPINPLLTRKMHAES